jgi:hypothetical protein
MSTEFGHDDIIYSQDAEARIQELCASLDGYDGSQHIVPDDFFNEDDRAEYIALTDFRDEVISQWGNEAWEKNVSLVADHYWNEYAQNAAEDNYTGADTPYWDKKLWSDDYQRGYEKVTYDGTEYWSDGER